MLCINVRLRFGVYDAAGIDDPLAPEWPPHPARLFCALVAASPDDGEWTALRWLEGQPSPEVHAPPSLGQQEAEQFLVTNATELGGGSQIHPGRKQNVRVKPRLMPAARTFRFVWPAAEPAEPDLSALAALARRVPYVGRVTADAELNVSRDLVEDDAALCCLEPVSLREGDFDLRVPYAGYCDQLIAAFDDGRHAWEASRAVAYRVRRPTGDEDVDPVWQSPYELMIFAVDGISYLDASLAVPIAEQLRKATLRRIDDRGLAIPPTVAGHGADGRPHVAYLALPNVGAPAALPQSDVAFVGNNPHADGRVLGVALAVPRGDEEASRALEQALLGVDASSQLSELALGRSGVMKLSRPLSGARRKAIEPRRWSRPSSWWASATPLALDRFPHSGRDTVEDLIAEAFTTAGYPRPAEVVVSRAPLLPGAPSLGRSRVQRRAGTPVRPWYHACVRFPSRVGGPVLVGSMRYRGLGLFVPMQPASDLGGSGK